MLFTGISLGSILLLVALGLAITYGLMGVINMAHGELMMIGAYATYVVQNLFRQLPARRLRLATSWLAIPASLPGRGAGGRGAGAQRDPLALRPAAGDAAGHLGHQPDPDAGACARSSARRTCGVENPAWLSGGVQVLPNLTLPYNRLAIIAFAALVLAGRGAADRASTRLGLFVRGVTQNRRMAACVGVNTARIDTYAFALGAGIAGLAGCALQPGRQRRARPGPGLHRRLRSWWWCWAAWASSPARSTPALGLGVLNKLLEGWQGAVLAKIMVLVFIVVFIQKRPQGIFAMKGRSAEA